MDILKLIELVKLGDISPTALVFMASVAIGLVVFSAYTGARPK